MLALCIYLLRCELIDQPSDGPLVGWCFFSQAADDCGTLALAEPRTVWLVMPQTPLRLVCSGGWLYRSASMWVAWVVWGGVSVGSGRV